MRQNRIHCGLVALHDVQDARHVDADRGPRLDHQLGEAHGDGRVALGRLQDEGIAAGDGDAEHPHRDHRGEVERRDPGADAERLAHRIDVDPRPRAFREFALQRMGNAAGELDDLKAALDVAFRVRDHLAVLAGERLGQRVHLALDEPLEFEHDTGPALRIDARPPRLRLQRARHGGVDIGRGREIDPCLDQTRIGIEYVTLTGGRRR